MHKTLLIIEIKEADESKFQFLKEIPGYEKSYPTSESNNPNGYIEFDFYYNKHFSFLDLRKYKSLINRRGGTVIYISSLSNRPPRISAKTKRILRNSTIIFAITYIPSLIGFPIVSPSLGINIEFIKAAQLAFLPAVFAFFGRVIIELKIQ